MPADAARLNHWRRFILVSTGSVFQLRKDKHNPILEGAAPEPANVYSTTGPRMLFARNCQWDCPSTNNALGAPASLIGQQAGFVDNQTCSVGTAKALFRVDAINAALSVGAHA